VFPQIRQKNSPYRIYTGINTIIRYPFQSNLERFLGEWGEREERFEVVSDGAGERAGVGYGAAGDDSGAVEEGGS
jgi:hypothetical protein